MQDFHQLSVWKKAHDLVLRVYRASNDLPASENFGLVLNLRRSAVVIARSIAEGSGRASDVEFAIELKGHERRAMILNTTYSSVAILVFSQTCIMTNSTRTFWKFAK